MTLHSHHDQVCTSPALHSRLYGVSLRSTVYSADVLGALFVLVGGAGLLCLLTDYPLSRLFCQFLRHRSHFELRNPHETNQRRPCVHLAPIRIWPGCASPTASTTRPLFEVLFLFLFRIVQVRSVGLLVLLVFLPISFCYLRGGSARMVS